MKLIDFHAHIYPEKIAQKAVESVGNFYHIPMDGNGTAEHLLSQGKEFSVSGYVVHSVAVDENHVQTVNNYIASECEKHQEFHGFGTMHAAYGDKIGELKRMQELGLKGVKIHPDTQYYNMNDDRMDEVYDYLQKEQLPLLIHCGDYRYDYSHPRRLKDILNRFPKLTVVAAHFGGWSVWDLALEYLKDANCYLDTSSSIPMLGTVRAEELIRLYGAERIVFGTDFPMWVLKDELEFFDKMSLNEKERELIFYQNAAKILKIPNVDE